MTGGGPQRGAVKVQRVRFSLGSTLLVIGAVVGALTVANLFEAARRPVTWAFAAAIAAWLLSWVIDALSRWMPRGLAVLATVLGSVVLAAGSWIGVRAIIRSGVDRLQTALPAAARDLEQHHRSAADFHLTRRVQSFVNSLDDRYVHGTQVVAAAETASSYIVSGVLMLFLVGYGPRFVSAALNQINDPVRRASVAAVVHQAAHRARAHLLLVLAQTIVITAVCSVVFFLLDLPAPFLLGLLVGWGATIPYFGVIIGGLAPLLAAATEPHGFTYPVVIGLLIAVQLVEALVIRPRVDRRTIRVGPTLMLVGNLIGFDLYGVGGAIYGTAALVFLWAVVQAMPDRRANPAVAPSG